jgi:Phosphotransferase enzyme family
MTATVSLPPLLIRDADAITGPWLSAVLGRKGLSIVGMRRIGTGQMSQTYRVTYTHAETTGTVVVKLASHDPTSRATGVGLGAYFREVAFYQRLSGRIHGPIPQCYLAEYDPSEGWFTLVLGDAIGAQQGDQVAGCDANTAEIVMRALARLHAPVFNDLATGTSDFLNLPNPIDQTLLSTLLPGFLARYGDQIAEEHAEVCRRYVAVADAHTADVRAPLGLVHGDFRLDNFLFGGSGECLVVDWQTVTWGPVMLDAAYFLGGSLDVEERRAHEARLVRVYYDTLLQHGVANFSWEQCWGEYRRQVYWGVAMVVAAAMVVERTKRGDAMFMAWLRRACQQVLDLGSLDLLPENAAAPQPLRPPAVDEEPHRPGSEPLWNESWYFDAVSDRGDVGLYVRLANVPNQGAGMYTVAVVRPGRPTVMVTDYTSAPPKLAAAVQTVTSGDYRATQQCIAPLEAFHVQFEGTAQQYTDDAAPLRGETGEPVGLMLDLWWRTDGVPYAWRASTRYEIPCHVQGTVSIAGDEFAFAGPGQRDHSWGSRDWWANDWMWTAFQLSDGTRVHAVTLPDLTGFAVGYVQRDREVVELTTGSATAVPGPDGLVERAELSLGTEPLEVDVKPQGFGALRMEAADGRIALFPRAMATFRTADGRTGSGWIEWNVNQR